jgi:SNF2 family DNA or RNA helicase
MMQEGNPLLDYIKKQSGSRYTPQIVAKGKDGKPAYKNLDKLNKLIAPHMYRVLKKDCLDLPPKVYKTALFKLTPEQKAIYKKAKEECRLVFEENETPFNKLVAMGKLAQITSGYYIHPLSEDPVRIEGDNPKLELLRDRVEEIVAQGNKVIIWARYRIEIEDICEALHELGLNVVQYHGGIKSTDRPAIIKEFEEGSAQVFVGNQQAGGTGITLVSASYVIYFSNDFSISNRLQSEDRAHRIGQEKTVTYINLAAVGTIDQIVIKSLEAKALLSDDIMGDSNFAEEIVKQLFQ